MPSKPPKSPGKYLVNKLTVDDARHLLKNEGGEGTVFSYAWQLLTTLVISGLCARAIVMGSISVWHLVLPMVAEYFAFLLYLPIIYVFFPLKDIRKEVMQSVRLVIGLTIGIPAYLAIRSHYDGVPWRPLADSYIADVRGWLMESYMFWPIVGSVIGVLINLPQRVYNVKKFGPPFVGVSLGCAARFLVFLVGAISLPILLADLPIARQPALAAVWSVWGMILAAELLALWMRWDIQWRLKKLDAPIEASPR